MSTLDKNNYKMFLTRHGGVIRCNHCYIMRFDQQLLIHNDKCKLLGPKCVNFDECYELFSIKRLSREEACDKLRDVFIIKSRQLNEMSEKYNNLQENHENLRKHLIKSDYLSVVGLLIIYIIFLQFSYLFIFI
jgi:hypothetical protein